MKKSLLCLILFLLFNLLYGQDVELDRINALDEFKWGVKFYNQGLYEKAVFSFERSLSFDSLDLRTHLWLGQAYFMKGDVEAALEEWTLLKEKEDSPLWLNKYVEIIQSKSGVLNKLYSVEEWVPLYSKKILRPSSILALNNGDNIIVSFMNNSLTVLNSNGAVIQTYNGGFEAFDKPFDIIQDDNNGFIVSEFMGNKISFINDLGIKVKSVKSTDSPLSGPGYLTKSSNGYFFVSDWGNRRVCKFDMDGNLILSIKNEELKRPSGVLFLENELYVADSLSKKILKFDNSGNLLSTLLSEGLEDPEGLSYKFPNSILIADGSTLKEYNLKTKVLSIITDLQGKASKITKGIVDVNGNTLTTDFNLGEFYSLTDISSLYGGLFIVIDRVISNGFPKMEIELQVYNRLGQPVIGLDNTNFLITENQKVVEKRNVIFKGHSGKSINLGIILDLDNSMLGYKDNIYDIIQSINDEVLKDDKVSLITYGQLPELVVRPNENILDMITKIKKDDFFNREGIDLSIKLAASEIISSRNKREIVLITTGSPKDKDFVKYSLNEIRDLLINNRISLSILYLNEVKNPELEYLVEQSNGSSRYMYQGIGSKGIVNNARDKKSGLYVLSYDSLKNIDNGEAFTTVEVEINFIRKSGRSESGFYVPVKVVN